MYRSCCRIIIATIAMSSFSNDNVVDGLIPNKVERWSVSEIKSSEKVSKLVRSHFEEAGVFEVKRKIKITATGISGQIGMETNESSNKSCPSQKLLVTKIIHFQRHGQGYHNLLGDMYRELGMKFDIDDTNPQSNPFVRPEIVDSPLTANGRKQAESCQLQTRSLSPQVVIVSPLHRALQTALLSFADHRKEEVPWIAHDAAREQLGLLTCNKRLPLSQTIKDYPDVDFQFVSGTDKDEMWNPHQRELPLDEADRIYDFLTTFVMKREEKEIAIVGHSAWLFNMCNAVMDIQDDELRSWFLTSEIRTMNVTFTSDDHSKL